MSKVHELKTDPVPFQAVLARQKTYEIRFNDRGYQVGDTLHLRETTISAKEARELPLHISAEEAKTRGMQYTGEEVWVTVSHILEGPIYGLAEGWVIMSIRDETIAEKRLRCVARDTDWVLAMAEALGPDSGYYVPIVPEPEPFRRLFENIKKQTPDDVNPNMAHPSHKLRSGDASTWDFICTRCGNTDQVPGGWGRLIYPCRNKDNAEEPWAIPPVTGKRID